MAKLSALQAAETIDAWTSAPCILRPKWPNPVCEDGAVVEVSTNLTVEELARLYRNRIIGVTYMTQVLVVHCAPSLQPEKAITTQLDAGRNETDMIWHTDMVQRSHGSVNIVLGHSSVPTGIAPKPLIRRKALEQAAGNDAQWPIKKLYGHWLHHDELELMYSEKTAYYLHTLHATSLGHDEELRSGITDAELIRMRAAFWDDIRALNSDPSILWFGQPDPEHAGTETALFISRMCFHNRGYAVPGTPRNGNKRRMELRPDNRLRNALDERFSTLRFDHKAPGIDTEWLKAL